MSTTIFDSQPAFTFPTNASKPPLQFSANPFPKIQCPKLTSYHHLHRVAARGDLVQLQLLQKTISCPSEFNVEDHDGNTPSHWAIRNNHLECLTFLLQSGANVNSMNRQGDTLLITASKCRNDQNLEIVRLLLSYNASPHLHNINEETPLHHSVVNQNLKITELLLENGASPNATEAEGESVLFWAIRESYSAILPLLFQHKVDVNLRNSDSETPLHFASCLNELQCVQLIVEQGKTCREFDINALDDDEQTPLEYALSNRNLAVVEFLEKNGATSSKSKRPRHI